MRDFVTVAVAGVCGLNRQVTPMVCPGVDKTGTGERRASDVILRGSAVNLL